MKQVQIALVLMVLYAVFFFMHSVHVLTSSESAAEFDRFAPGRLPVPPNIPRELPSPSVTKQPPRRQTKVNKVRDSAAVMEPETSSVNNSTGSQIKRNILRNMGIYVIACKRPNYLRRTLESLTQLVGASDYEIVVSQDGFHEETANVARSFDIELVQHNQPSHLRSPTKFVANHYKEAFNHAFDVKKFDRVIVVEEDMIFSPDFILYFEQTSRLMDEDPTIWCISTWNDNGFKNLVSDHRALMRTSYFPGLGWMLKKVIWDELKDKWPKDHWDHWMRLYPQNKNRECIIPEVPRNYNIGEVGANINDVAYKKFLSNIKHNDQIVDLGDISYLLEKEYDKLIRSEINSSIVRDISVVYSNPSNMKLVIPYVREEFKRIATEFGIWDIPRPHHRFVSIIKWRSNVVYLIDKRRSPYIPPDYAINPPETMTIIAAQPYEGCDTACVQKGKSCSDSLFDFINTCEVLFKYFECPKGCGFEMGPDIPNYVFDKSHPNFGVCLVTDAIPKCDARHKSTQRLCPCA